MRIKQLIYLVLLPLLGVLILNSCSDDEEVTPRFKLILTQDGQGEIVQSIIQDSYKSGTEVALIAKPSEGYEFAGWSGNITSTDNPVIITFKDFDFNIHANFQKLPSIYLDENGVTVKAYEYARIGEIYELNGINYLVVDGITLREMVGNDLNLENIVTTKVTDMAALFKDKSTFNQDISSWDVSNVINMSNMFYNATMFNADISYWNVSNVNDMSFLFKDAFTFNQDISKWNVGGVTNMYMMFMGAQNFNQDIGGWNVSKVTDMGYMFAGNGSNSQNLFNHDISRWNVSSVQRMIGMLSFLQDFNVDLSEWKVDEVSNCTYFSIGSNSWTLPKPKFTNCSQ